MRIETHIRKALGMKAHWVPEVRETEGGLEVLVERLGKRHLRCGECGMEVNGTRGRLPRERRWRDLSVRDKVLWIIYRPYRVACPRCGIRVERVPWAPRFSRVTTALAKAVALLAKKLSWKEVAEHFQLNWKTVAKIIRWVVSEGLKLRQLQPLHILGIDEVSRKKGHTYFTLFYDLERGGLLWVSEGRTEGAVDLFFAWLGKRRTRTIQAICLDMWAPYLASVKRHAPHALTVFDRFHLVRHLNDAVDKVRREMVQRLQGEEKSTIKGTRYLWLKNPWNLTETERLTLSTLLTINMPIVRAYMLKEAFQKFWDYFSPGWAEKWLRQWFWWATHSRLKPLRDFAHLLRRHEAGILAWIKLRISNGALEGMNHKIKLVSRRAYGFRDPYNFVIAIFHGCADLPMPL